MRNELSYLKELKNFPVFMCNKYHLFMANR